MPGLRSDVAELRSRVASRLAVVVVVASALTSCSNPGPQVGDTSPSTTTAVVTESATTAVDGQRTTTSTDSGRDLASDEELEAVIALLPLRSPPTGDAEGSYRAFAIERVEFYASCLTDEGMAVEIDYVDLGVTYRIPEGQENTYNRIKAECRVATRERFGMTDHPQPADLERWYQAYVWTWRCLSEFGYTLNDPPTIDSFVDSGGANWQPYAELVLGGGAPDGEERRALEEACPQDVDYLLLFLGI